MQTKSTGTHSGTFPVDAEKIVEMSAARYKIQRILILVSLKVAGPSGFEPLSLRSERRILPLNEGPVSYLASTMNVSTVGPFIQSLPNAIRLPSGWMDTCVSPQYPHRPSDVVPANVRAWHRRSTLPVRVFASAMTLSSGVKPLCCPIIPTAARSAGPMLEM